MNTDRTFSDDDLTAFLDGEAGKTLADDIENALATDPKLTTRLENLTVPLDSLRHAFDAQLASAPPVPNLFATNQIALPQTIVGRKGFWPGLGVGLVAGVTGAAILLNAVQPTQKSDGWLDVVANYQMLYVPETLDPPRRSTPGGNDRTQGYAADLASLSDVIGTNIEDLYRVNGLTFHRAQLLGFRGKPLIQVAYSLPDGTPIAICIVPSDTAEKSPRAQVLQGMAASDWTTGSHGVLVIGGEDQSIVNDIAQTVMPLI
ncbi:MAG: hypothetical protein AAF754_00585 [Pseudomonadota bacterium]